MKEERTTIPASANNLATSEILRIFSSRSSGLNPRFLLRPKEEGREARQRVGRVEAQRQERERGQGGRGSEISEGGGDRGTQEML